MVLTKRFCRDRNSALSHRALKAQDIRKRHQQYRMIFDLINRPSVLRDCVIFVCAVAVYLNTLEGEFIFDDIPAILRNPDVVGNTTLFRIFKNDFWGEDILSDTSHKSYRPLCVLTFRLNYYLHEFHPAFFHLVNVLVHAIVSVLVSLLCRDVVFRVDSGNCGSNAFVAGILFALHPIHTEAVASLVGRAELLAGMFYIVTLLLHNCSLKSKSSIGRLLLLIFCLISSTCAMLMKETGIAVLGIVLVIETFNLYGRFCTDRNHSLSRHGLRMVLIILWTLVLLYFRLSVMGWKRPHFATPDNPASKSRILKTRFLTYSYLVWVNIRLLAYPVTLSYDWSYGTIPLVESWADCRNITSFTVLMVLFGALLRILWKCYHELALSQETIAAIMLVVPYIPCSNMFFPVGYVIAERTLYIPSIGFVILLVLLWNHLFRQDHKNLPVLAYVLLFTLIALYSTKTFHRNEDWQSKEALFRSGVETAPQNAKIRYNWANYLRETRRYDEAAKQYEETLKLYPSYPGALNNLATILEKNESTLDKAQELYIRLIHVEPNRAEAYMNLASLFVRRKMYEKAAKVFFSLVSRRIVPITETVSLAHILVKNNLMNHAETLIQVVLRRFCIVLNNKRIMDVLNLRPNSGSFFNPSSHCMEEKREYARAMVIYAEILNFKGMREESRVVREYI